MPASIPSPSSNGFYLGPLFVHYYGLCYVVGITAAILLTRRLWREKGGDPDLVYTVAIWGVPAGIIGGRLYHDVTSWNEVPHNWWGWLAIWQGGLGIWGGILGGLLGGIIPLRRAQVSIAQLHGRGRPGASGRAGDRTGRQLLQPGAVRRPHQPALGPADQPLAPPRRIPGLLDLPTDVPVRADLGPRARGDARLADPPHGGFARRGSSRCTSPAIRRFASSRSCCASTPPTTSSGSA